MDEDDMEIEELEPTELSTESRGNFLEINKDRLRVKYVGAASHSNDVGAVQGNRPVPRKRLVYYFEIYLIETGDRNNVSIGFTDKNFKHGRHVGWEPYSYGYHADDGKKFENSESGADYGPTFGTGDTIGAGIKLEKQEIFFTKNGQLLPVAFKKVRVSPLFPTIALHSTNEHVEANFGAKPFKFDLEAMIASERKQEQENVQNQRLGDGVAHQVVRDYLLHYGYADTLETFDVTAGVGPAVGEPPESWRVRPEAKALQTRKAVRTGILGGDIDGVSQLLRVQFPTLLAAEGASLDVVFQLNAQKFVELIRQNRVEEAAQFAREVLGPLRGKGGYDAMLHDVVALIAYEKPEDCALSHLLGTAQRESVADVVNAAMLSHAPGGKRLLLGDRPQAALERLLQQLILLKEEFHERNGGQGEVFRLREHLIPQAPS